MQRAASLLILINFLTTGLAVPASVAGSEPTPTVLVSSGDLQHATGNAGKFDGNKEDELLALIKQWQKEEDEATPTLAGRNQEPSAGVSSQDIQHATENAGKFLDDKQDNVKALIAAWQKGEATPTLAGRNTEPAISPAMASASAEKFLEDMSDDIKGILASWQKEKLTPTLAGRQEVPTTRVVEKFREPPVPGKAPKFGKRHDHHHHATGTGAPNPTSTGTSGWTGAPNPTSTGTSGGTSGGNGGSGSGDIKKYYQCGGKDWKGTGTCMSGLTCKYWNPWYSQCL